MPETTSPVAAIVGVGPGNGAAIARTFSEAGYRVALMARSETLIAPLAAELAGALAVRCDVTDAASIEQAFTVIETRMGPVDTLIYNAGSGVWGTFDDVDAAALESSWRINALGLFNCARQVTATMKAAGRGNILVVGATASRRGAAGAAAFAPAKAAQRTLAESMARHLGPSGIHVALVIIDGRVDAPKARKASPEKPDWFFVKPRAVAKNLLWLARQDRSAWSFEIEARPYAEKW